MADSKSGGGDVRVQNAPLMSNAQMLLLDQMIQGVKGSLQGTKLGSPWVGPYWQAYAPKEFKLTGNQSGVYKPWDLRKQTKAGGADPKTKDPEDTDPTDPKGKLSAGASSGFSTDPSGASALLSALASVGGDQIMNGGGSGFSTPSPVVPKYPTTAEVLAASPLGDYGYGDAAIPGTSSVDSPALSSPMNFNRYAQRDLYTTPLVSPLRAALGRGSSRYSMPYGY